MSNNRAGQRSQCPDEYSVRLAEPMIGGSELELISEALKGKWIFGAGPHLEKLEFEFTRLIGADAVALSSGTAAIHLALVAIGVKAGEEVLVSSQTFAGSCYPILYVGGVPTFIDSDAGTWTLDANLLEDVLMKRASTNSLPSSLSDLVPEILLMGAA